jgi:tetratricopeptide (TPR) repeat protein
MARAQTLSLDDAHNLFRLGLMHQQLESHQTALRCLSQAYGAEAHMGLIPRKPLSKGILLVQMAYSFLRVGDQPAAKKCIEVAASLGSEIHDSWEQIGLSALKTSQVPLALHAYESALQAGPLGADGCNNLGLLYSKCGLPHKARHCYQEAIQKDPSHQEALINLAHLELQAGRLQTARELFRRLVQGGRRDPDVLVGLGFIALQLNDREDMSQLGEIIAETRKHNSPDSPPGTGNPFQDLSARLLRDGKPELARWARSIADKSALTTIHFEESRSI